MKDTVRQSAVLMGFPDVDCALFGNVKTLAKSGTNRTLTLAWVRPIIPKTKSITQPNPMSLHSCNLLGSLTAKWSRKSKRPRWFGKSSLNQKDKAGNGYAVVHSSCPWGEDLPWANVLSPSKVLAVGTSKLLDHNGAKIPYLNITVNWNTGIDSTKKLLVSRSVGSLFSNIYVVKDPLTLRMKVSLPLQEVRRSW